jgi:hypothetical protein
MDRWIVDTQEVLDYIKEKAENYRYNERYNDGYRESERERDYAVVSLNPSDYFDELYEDVKYAFRGQDLIDMTTLVNFIEGWYKGKRWAAEDRNWINTDDLTDAADVVQDFVDELIGHFRP